MKVISIKNSNYPVTVPHGLMFHRFHRNNQIPGQGSFTEMQFEKLLLHVGIDRILSPDEWLSRVKSNGLRDGDLCITLDDGLKSQFEVALPVLERHGLKAFFFIISSVFEGGVDLNEVYSQFATTKFSSFNHFAQAFFEYYPVSDKQLIESGFESFSKSMHQMFSFYSELDVKYRFVRNTLKRELFDEIMSGMIETMGLKVSDIAQHLWMNNLDLKNLSQKGHYIGLHSYSHPLDISKLSESDQKKEYQLNMEHLSGITNKKIEAVAHPLNSYNESTLRILSKMDIRCGFRSNMTSANKITNNELEFAREDSSNVLRQMGMV